MKVIMGSDHGGYPLKEEMKRRLLDEGYLVDDEGCADLGPVDYPDVAFRVARRVAGSDDSLGILICGTGIGMSNAASMVEGITAALCMNTYMAKMARLHNNANILCMGGRVIGDEVAWAIISTFLGTEPLMDEKYNRRRGKVENYRRC